MIEIRLNGLSLSQSLTEQTEKGDSDYMSLRLKNEKIRFIPI